MMSILHTTIPALLHLHFVQATFMDKTPVGANQPPIGTNAWWQGYIGSLYNLALTFLVGALVVSGILYMVSWTGVRVKRLAKLTLKWEIIALIVLQLVLWAVDSIKSQMP